MPTVRILLLLEAKFLPIKEEDDKVKLSTTALQRGFNE